MGFDPTLASYHCSAYTADEDDQRYSFTVRASGAAEAVFHAKAHARDMGEERVFVEDEHGAQLFDGHLMDAVTGPAGSLPPDERPLAAEGLTSYRCRGRYGWIMIGARDHEDALREARRSHHEARIEDLQIWNGVYYADLETPAPPALLEAEERETVAPDQIMTP